MITTTDYVNIFSIYFQDVLILFYLIIILTDTLDSIQPEVRSEDDLLPKNKQLFAKTVIMPETDVGDGDSANEFDLIYDTLDVVPKKSEQLDASLWKPPDRSSLVPVISIVCLLIFILICRD